MATLHNPQRFRQKRVVRCETYQEAQEVCGSMTGSESKPRRIKRRAAGYFDVIEYERIPAPVEQD
jgi:hypothetical protein